METKNILTVTRGVGLGDNRKKSGKKCQETCIKDTWTKKMGSGGGLNVGSGGG